MFRASNWLAVTLCAAVLQLPSATGSDVGAADVCSESVRFLVDQINGHPRHESYVLPLSDPAAIAHARKLIEFGASAGQPIVVADVAHGANGINRNYAVPGAPPWTWHVSKFLWFADTTAEILDGWPGMLENGIDEPLHETYTNIGFWSYSVVAELPQGDFDADLDIDLDDYATWRQSYGATLKNLAADGSGNGIVDTADYVVWRNKLNASASILAIAVPEPTAFTIIELVGVSLLRYRRRILPCGRR
jgi:hypothetical protein